ncbi:MAG: hypothetical protein ACKVTZ_13620 [Bacteroidia bacterium]
MKHLFVIILGVVCYFHGNAQSLLADRFTTTYTPISATNQAAERFCTALHQVVMDLPTNFQETKGEVLVNNSLQKAWKSDIHVGNFTSEEIAETENGISWNGTAAKKVAYNAANEAFSQINTYVRGCKSIMALEPDENAQMSKTRGTGEVTATNTWTIVEPLEHPLVGTQIVTSIQPEGNTWQVKVSIKKIKE